MATTGWMWQTIHRGIDEVTSSGALYRRNHWELVRFRMSNDAYVSQKGETTLSLSAENGGVTETVDAEIGSNGFRFSSVAGFEHFIDVEGGGASAAMGRYGCIDAIGTWDWQQVGSSALLQYDSGAGKWKITQGGILYYSKAVASSVAPYAEAAQPWTVGTGGSPAPTLTAKGGNWAQTGSVWIPTALTKNGELVYELYQEQSAPNPNLKNIAWYDGTNWVAASVTEAEFSGESWNNVVSNANYPEADSKGWAKATVGGTALDGLVLEGGYHSYWDGTDGTISTDGVVLPLTCVDETQDYPNPYVSWYKQTQRWTYLDPFVAV